MARSLLPQMSPWIEVSLAIDVSPDKSLVLGRSVHMRRELGWWEPEKDSSVAICNPIAYNTMFIFKIITYFIFCHQGYSLWLEFVSTELETYQPSAEVVERARA